jgi:hypothetical protein
MHGFATLTRLIASIPPFPAKNRHMLRAAPLSAFQLLLGVCVWVVGLIERASFDCFGLLAVAFGVFFNLFIG